MTREEISDLAEKYVKAIHIQRMYHTQQGRIPVALLADEYIIHVMDRYLKTRARNHWPGGPVPFMPGSMFMGLRIHQRVEHPNARVQATLTVIAVAREGLNPCHTPR